MRHLLATNHKLYLLNNLKLRPVIGHSKSDYEGKKIESLIKAMSFLIDFKCIISTYNVLTKYFSLKSRGRPTKLKTRS